MREAADDRVFVREAGEPRQLLADVEAGHIGADRFEVEGILLRRPAPEEEVDAGIGAAARRHRRRRGRLKERGQREAPGGPEPNHGIAAVEHVSGIRRCIGRPEPTCTTPPALHGEKDIDGELLSDPDIGKHGIYSFAKSTHYVGTS